MPSSGQSYMTNHIPPSRRGTHTNPLREPQQRGGGVADVSGYDCFNGSRVG